eukprot:CAMPEP_0195517964 /NCGR_PEP_ID=MMETSP0794_2-20130614/11847_1 /TAXON_ID=515487 /ORGANISM="Stephanopyxis turris, Strain CCMP 815" /LENGTH=178 /DNA_ID=CAMNT_0040646851 /DNA_START=351 /DNA_END=887 /DNA_ORIENTATION=-
MALWGKDKTRVPKITKVESMDDFLAFLAEDPRLAIVKFHASWCKSCQKFDVRYKKLALEKGDICDGNGDIIEPGQMRFADVEFGKNAKLCRTLGVKRLPYIHMYRGAEGLLEDFACGPKKFPMLEEKIDEKLQMSQEEINFNMVMDEGTDLNDDIMTELKWEQYQEAARATVAANKKD